MTDNRIVCAANLYDNGMLILGVRHFCPVMRQQMNLINPNLNYWKAIGHQQGFVDKFGTFKTREEAWIIASEANQIIRRCGGDGSKLFSENLY